MKSRIGGMTVTEPTVRHPIGAPWTVEDLFNVDDDTHRYELYEGVLLVSPVPGTRHLITTTDLEHILYRAAPADLFVSAANAGVYVSDRTYFIPDIVVVPRSVFTTQGRGAMPADLRLAVEVLSPSNAGYDLGLKRQAYAKAGIPLYWIVDPEKRAITVLNLRDGAYIVGSVVRAGERFTTDEPFPVEFDPAEIF